MIEKIDNNQIPNFLSESSAKQADTSNGSSETQVDASLQVSYDSLIEEAKQLPKEDTEALQRAQQLLLSGQLDSPENIRKTAENIAKFGV